MTELFLTITRDETDQNAFVLDGKGARTSDTLKSLCIVWHGSATHTISPLSSSVTTATALRSSLIPRSATVSDSNLVVSQQIFNVLKTALQANEKLRFGISDHGDQEGTFKVQIVTGLGEDDPLPVIAQTVTRMDQRLEHIEGDVQTIREILQAEIDARSSVHAKLMSSARPSKHPDHTATHRGAEGGNGKPD